MNDPHCILLVEDDDDDAELTARAFDYARVANLLVRVNDGVEALDYLFGRGAYAGRDTRALPIVVLLDLHLPRLDGFEVVKAIRAHERTRHLPVVALTSSDHERDRLVAYLNQINSYIRKPVDYDQFVDAARQIGLYWVVLNMSAPIVPP